MLVTLKSTHPQILRLVKAHLFSKILGTLCPQMIEGIKEQEGIKERVVSSSVEEDGEKNQRPQLVPSSPPASIELSVTVKPSYSCLCKGPGVCSVFFLI